MATAGTVEINFAAETAKFTAEVRKVRSELTDLQKQTAVISRGFATAGRAIAGAFAGVTIAAAVRAVVQATSEAEESSARLTNALQSSGAAAELSVDQLQDYSSELQRTTTYGDEAIQGVEALLLSFQGLSGDTILKATSAVLDLSARMGIDLRAAALQVGKALADPVKGLTALARSGVQFSESQKATIKSLVDSGNAARAQSIILAELEKRFGGAAAAARNTFGGAIAGLKNAFGDLLEARDGMPAATSAVNRLADTLNSPDVKNGFDNIISGMSRLIELSAGAAAALPKVGSAIGDFFVGAFNIKVFEDAGARMRAELAFEQKELEKMQGFWSLASDEQIVKQKAYIETLKERVKLAEHMTAAERSPLTPFVPTVQKIPTGTAAAAAEPGTAEFQKQLEIRQKLVTATIATMANELDAFDASRTEIETRIGKYTEDRVKNTEALIERRVQFNIEALNRELQATLQTEQQKYQAVTEYEKQKRDLQEGTVSAGIGLLQSLAVRSKAASKALILVNRGVAIAQTVQNTIAAASKALAIYGPTPQGFAAAAAVKAWGAVQVGLLVATAATEISNVNSGAGGGIGGGTLGTPSNPLPVTSEPTGAQQGRVIQVIINGNIAGPDSARWIVEQLADAINGSDTVLINGNSRQAAEIRGG